MKKTNKWLDLLLFTIVPESHLLLFFVAKGRYKSQLDRVAAGLGMSEGQLIFFEVLTVLLYSVLVFLLSFFISQLVMGWFSKKVQKDKLFVSFVIGTSLANLVGVFAFDALRYSSAILLACVQVALLAGLYCGFTKAKDLKGVLALGTVNVAFDLVPALLVG